MAAGVKYDGLLPGSHLKNHGMLLPVAVQKQFAELASAQLMDPSTTLAAASGSISLDSDDECLPTVAPPALITPLIVPDEVLCFAAFYQSGANLVAVTSAGLFIDIPMKAFNFKDRGMLAAKSRHIPIWASISSTIHPRMETRLGPYAIAPGTVVGAESPSFIIEGGSYPVVTASSARIEFDMDSVIAANGDSPVVRVFASLSVKDSNLKDGSRPFSFQYHVVAANGYDKSPILVPSAIFPFTGPGSPHISFVPVATRIPDKKTGADLVFCRPSLVRKDFHYAELAQDFVYFNQKSAVSFMVPADASRLADS